MASNRPSPMKPTRVPTAIVRLNRLAERRRKSGPSKDFFEAKNRV
jgi:hypothetical protein